MQRRIFAAINLPLQITRDLGVTMDRIKPLFGSEVRFLNPEGWHITLSFLGDQEEDAVSRISQALAETAAGHEISLIQFKNILLGPIGKSPRMIWLVGSAETSMLLGNVKKDFDQKLQKHGINFKQEHRQFNAHVTLAKFNRTLSGLQPLDVPFERSFEPQSLDLMESHLGPAGAEYDLLSKFDLKEIES